MIRIKSWALCIGCAALLFIAGCAGQNSSGTGATTLQADSATIRMSDVEFARTAFTHLATGNPAAEPMLGWDALHITGIDAGKAYNDLPNEEQKEAFRKSFLKGYASSFQKSAGSDGKTAAARVKNWKLLRRSGKATVISGEIPNGRITLTLSGSGAARKVTDLALE